MMYGKLADRLCNVSSGLTSLNEMYQRLNCLPLSPLAVQNDIQLDSNRTLLMSAAKGGNMLLCQDMLRHTTRGINTQNSKGYTALHFACFNGHNNIAILLAQSGADIFIRNCYGESAMETAKAAGYQGLSFKLWESYYIPSVDGSSSGDWLLPKVECAVGSGELLKLDNQLDNERKNYEYLRSQNYNLWFDMSKSVSPHTPAESTTHLTALLLGSTHCCIGGSHGVCEEFSIANHYKESVITTRQLKGCVLEVTSCEPGCTDVTTGTVFDFSDLLQNQDENGCVHFTIGRSRSSSVCLPDLSVSKQHALLNFIVDAGLCVSDFSKHGTCVNDLRVHNLSSSSNVSKKYAFLRFVNDTLSVGRIHLTLKKKKKSGESTLSQSFQPNPRFGEQLVRTLKQEQAIESRQIKARMSRLGQVMHRQLEHNISHRVAAKRNDIKTSEDDTPRKRSCHEDRQNSADFDSESFIGRSLLTKYGWTEGSSLGKRSEKVFSSDIFALPKNECKSGLGKKVDEAHTCNEKTYKGDNVWLKAHSRYADISKSNKGE